MAQVTYICSVKDNAARTFGQPFFVPHTAVAVRSFTDEVNRVAEDNQVFQHYRDYDLYLVGSFDDQSGVCRGVGPDGEPDSPQLVVRGADVRVSPQGGREDRGPTS